MGKKERGEQERGRRIFIQIYCGREEERERRGERERSKGEIQRDMQVPRHNSIHYTYSTLPSGRKTSHNFQTNIHYRLGALLTAAMTSANSIKSH